MLKKPKFFKYKISVEFKKCGSGRIHGDGLVHVKAQEYSQEFGYSKNWCRQTACNWNLLTLKFFHGQSRAETDEIEDRDQSQYLGFIHDETTENNWNYLSCAYNQKSKRVARKMKRAAWMEVNRRAGRQNYYTYTILEVAFYVKWTCVFAKNNYALRYTIPARYWKNKPSCWYQIRNK